MIIICGIAHSYTSVTAKFIRDNGGRFDRFRDAHSDILKYEVYEDEILKEWAEKKKKFIKTPFKKRNIIAKYPEACYFLKDIPDDVKIISGIRNPGDLIISNYTKYNRGFHITFNKFTYAWNNIAKAKQNVYILMTERLIERDGNEAKRLLNFAGLNPEKIVFNIGEINQHRKNYKEYRMLNLIWKISYSVLRFLNI